jgi:osmotically-inducible protein OsmY
MRSVKTNAQNSEVEVEGRDVTLRDKARSYAEKIEAERAARMAPGVISVKNEIVVSYI